jgi:hypothetical protein
MLFAGERDGFGVEGVVHGRDLNFRVQNEDVRSASVST